MSKNLQVLFYGLRIALVGLLAGCAAQIERPRSLDATAIVLVEHGPLNRCGDVAETSCRSAADCPKGPCVSALPTDAGAFGRDGGHTVQIGDRVLWQFGDTFAVAGMLSATAAWSDTADPLALRDAVAATGRPVQFLPFTAGELAYNEAHANPPPCCAADAKCPSDEPYCNCPANTDCTTRIALWPGDGAATGSGGATIYYDRQIVGVAPYDFAGAGIGVATVRAGAPTATRMLTDSGEPVLLFAADEPHFARGMQVDDPDGSFFYLYANTNRVGCSVDVLLARVPLEHMSERAHFRFWTGSQWSATLADARPIARSIPGALGSVSWNEHLQAYLSVWSDICTGGQVLALRSAPAPQGPWSEAVAVDLTPLGAQPDAYYGMAHPEFGRGREIVVTYFQPLDLVYGQMRLLRLTLP